VPKTSPPPPQERVTPRQRRIEEQRRKIETLRRQQQRRRALWGAAIVVAVALVAALAFFLIRPATPAQGHPVPIEGNRQHVPQGTDIAYKNRPPSSGDHYDQPSGYGVFDRAVPTGNWVHNLEHGGIVVLYKPEQCDQACVNVLKEAYNSVPSSQYFPGVHKMIVMPYEDMDTPIAVVAWGWEDDMAQPDKDRIVAFYRAHVDRGPEVGAL
jgi:Protein of unknown function (DUF3105)